MNVACSSDPLQDHSYLLSVVETITASLHEPSLASIHDLLDAYATFTHRVRSHSQLLDTCAALLPALAPLRVHKDTFVRVLQRDVRLAHVDPLLTLSRPSDASLLESSMCLNISVDAKQYARDSSSLCHHALCALSTILRFPAFHFVFPEHDLSVLFGDVLDIALSEHLLVLNEVKTYSLSLWILSSHRLSATVLSSRRDDVFSALQRSLDGESHPDSIILDGLKAISHTIEYYPSAFLELLSPLLPCVMTSLLCESSERRLHASIALGNFANALIHQRELSLTKWQTLSGHITSYLESCCDESQIAPGNAGFSRIVRAAFSAEPRAYPRVAPAWMLSVLASLIVLCGPTLYRKPTVLRFIFQALAMALTHKRSIIRALHPHVWSCFVWTFSRMLSNSADVEPEFISSAFYLIKQEISGGIGMALTNVLLFDCMTAARPDERSDRVSQALSVVKAMVRTECKRTRQEGFMFLQAFTNVDQVRHQISQSMYELPASVLFNGAIAGAKWDNLPSILHSIPKVPFPMRWLEVAEVAQHHKTLLLIWKCSVTKADRKDLNPSRVDAWLSILLACSYQLKHGQHNTMTTDVPRYAAAIIVEFLPPLASEDRQPDWGSWNIHDQRCSLTFIDQLWSAMREAFVTLNLAEAAECILASILKYAFHILDAGIRTLWSKLCANLLIIASPSCLSDIHEQSTRSVIRSRRELWAVIAISLSPLELGLDWKELVKFLSIPVCTWVLSKSELGAWEALLRNAITLAGDSTVVTEHFILHHVHRKEVETWESIVAVLSFLLVCTDEQGNFPTDNLLSMADGCLIASYGRAGRSPEALAHSLEFLNVIRRIIVSAPAKVMHILQILCSSLCLWIEDHSEVMSNDEFNSVAVSLYCETLQVLKILPLSLQSLRDMENFLASAFSRIPTPAIAPFAFEEFWRATYHGHSQFCSILPPKIKSCLACFVAAYGGDLAHGLTLSSESQAQSTQMDGSMASPSANTHDFCVESNGFQANLPINAGTSEEVSSRKVVQYGQHQTLAGQEDTPFLVSPSDEVLQVTASGQLREHSSRIDASPPGDMERLTSKSQILIPSGDVIPGAHLAEKNQPIASYVLHQERRDDVSPKRSRTSRDVLCSVRGLESEPATREVTTMGVPRMRSVPLKKQVFDGVEVPSLRGVLRQKKVPRAKTSNTLDIEQGPTSIPQTPSPHGAHEERASPTALSPFVGSAVEDLDWENFRVHSTSSEIDVDRSLMDFGPSSPPRTRNLGLHERDSYSPSRLNSRKAMPQGEGSPTPTRLSLRRTKPTLARLDALRDIYASITNGASQIPMSELVQATRLVHQIGVALTEQIDKRMGDSR